jgi:hypothetical protein
MAKAVGIDLGTINSVIAVWEGGEPSVVPNSEGNRTTPSVVAFTDTGERLVGQLARRQAILNPKGTIYSAKRFIGRHFDEISDEARAVAYDVVEGDGGAARFKVRDKLYAPEEISAQVLRKLADDASKQLGERVTEAVITVPAYFNDAQRTATKDAGRIAGLEVLRIINEPTAAALAYGMDKKQHETVLVFDLGGGTFDVSILDVGDGVVEVRSTAGDSHLGGDDFDRRLVDYLADDFQKANGIDLRKDPQALQRLFEAAEKAKTECRTRAARTATCTPNSASWCRPPSATGSANCSRSSPPPPRTTPGGRDERPTRGSGRHRPGRRGQPSGTNGRRPHRLDGCPVRARARPQALPGRRGPSLGPPPRSDPPVRRPRPDRRRTRRRGAPGVRPHGPGGPCPHPAAAHRTLPQLRIHRPGARPARPHQPARSRPARPRHEE